MCEHATDLNLLISCFVQLYNTMAIVGGFNYEWIGLHLPLSSVRRTNNQGEWR